MDVKLAHSSAPADHSFWEGKLLAYNEVISLMLNQARAFGIESRKIGLEGFDPDRDL